MRVELPARAFFRVSVPLVIAVGILTAGVFFLAIRLAVRAQRRPARMGQSSLVGRTGRVRTPIGKQQPGKVHLASELWTAELTEDSPPVEEGDEVEVTAVAGLRLKVRKKPEA